MQPMALHLALPRRRKERQAPSAATPHPPTQLETPRSRGRRRESAERGSFERRGKTLAVTFRVKGGFKPYLTTTISRKAVIGVFDDLPTTLMLNFGKYVSL